MLRRDTNLVFEKIKITVIIFISVFFFFQMINLSFPTVRIGDGSNYYAMAIAWSSNKTPFMEEKTWSEYDRVFHSNQIIDLVSTDLLKRTSPQLTVNQTKDFNHFWFYSFLAGLFGILFQILHIKISIQMAFIILHSLLFSIALATSYYTHRFWGIFTVLILVITSPITWYINKVHTEVFTFCTVITSIMLFSKKKYFTAALFLSITATQNISFSLISLIQIVIGIVSKRKSNKFYTFIEAISLTATAVIVILHPMYYFFRYGILTPQLSTGVASVGANLRSILVWFIDPDIGLLPNWPISVLFIAFFIIIRVRTRKKFNFENLLFISLFIIVSLIAQSSTVNINSGGTTGIARYATWYIPLFFWPVMAVIQLMYSIREKLSSVVFVLILFFFTVYNLFYNFPDKKESYDRPTPFSWIIQKNLPKFYNPPTEVFSERYCGIGESPVLYNALAVVGPDAHKILLFNRPDKELILGINMPLIDLTKLRTVLKEQISSIKKNEIAKYIFIDQKELREMKVEVKKNEWYYFDINSANINWLEGGWSQNEIWGTWSEGKTANLMLPIFHEQNVEDMDIDLRINCFIANENDNRRISIYKNGKQKIWEGLIGHDYLYGKILSLKIPVSKDDISVKLQINIENPISPKEIGQSTDPRKLGIGIMGLMYK